MAATFTDRDDIIARDDLPQSQLATSNQTIHSFETALSVPSPDNPHPTRSGAGRLVDVDLKFRGKSLRFVDTHLEALATAGCEANGKPH